MSYLCYITATSNEQEIATNMNITYNVYVMYYIPLQ